MRTSGENEPCAVRCTTEQENPSYIARMEKVNHQLCTVLERLAIIIHPYPAEHDGKCEEAEPSQLGRLNREIEAAEESVEDAIIQIDRIVSAL